jgi:hypothetical protein
LDNIASDDYDCNLNNLLQQLKEKDEKMAMTAKEYVDIDIVDSGKNQLMRQLYRKS